MIKGNKNMLPIENDKKKKKKKKKKELVSTGFAYLFTLIRGRPHGPESNVTTTAPANYVFQIESNFYIINI